MEISKTPREHYLELHLGGRLDNESSQYFRETMEAAIREGWRHVLVDMAQLRYISSAGISVLITSKRQLEELNGAFGIHTPPPTVERVLQQTRLLDRLLSDPKTIQHSGEADSHFWEDHGKTRAEPGLELQTYRRPQKAPLTCECLGTPEPLFESAFSRGGGLRVDATPTRMALGLGALGDDASECGEFLSAAGAVAVLRAADRGLPDYSVGHAEFVPTVQVHYGLQFSGEFSDFVRFNSSEPGTHISISTLATACLRQLEADSCAWLLLAESAGLVGAHLRCPPTEASAAPAGRMAFPEIRRWFSFNPEPVHRHTLALVVGVATRQRSELFNRASALLRPLGPDGEMWGHFHAAVFPYRPLKSGVLDMLSTVSEQFESGQLRDVLHLLHDDRTLGGLGESQFDRGVCWLGRLGSINVRKEKT